MTGVHSEGLLGAVTGNRGPNLNVRFPTSTFPL